MDWYLNKIRQISVFLNVLSGISITFIVALTVTDVILRSFRNPIIGTYELVSFTGALVIGMSIPMTSWHRGHIFVDFIIVRWSNSVQAVFNILTRLMGLALFYLVGTNLWKVALDLKRTGEVSPTLELPFYYAAFAVSICSFVQCLVLTGDIVKILGGKYE